MKLKLQFERRKSNALNNCILLFVFLLTIFTSAQTTRYVNGATGNDAGNCTNPENPCETIFYAYEMSDFDDTIEVSEGIYTEFFDIDKSISIVGAGQNLTVIQAHNSPELSNNRIFKINPGFDVSISELTIRHGKSLSGGGIYNIGSTITLSNIIFEDNFAFNYGGGIQNFDATANLTNVIFRNNSAIGGGGGMRNDNSSVELNDISFINNFAEVSGGGLYNVNTSGVFSNIYLLGNTALNSGGGMVNFDHSSPTLINCVFSGNKSVEGGGGLVNVFQSSPILINVTFSGNHTDQLGGGILNIDHSSPVLSNIIIWGNSSENETTTTSASISNIEFSNPVISYSLIDNSGGSTNWNTQIGIDEGNNVADDPMFIDQPDPDNAPTELGNLRLLEGSPAIDFGDPDTDFSLFPGGIENPLDLDGNLRLYNDFIDLGAYEYQGSMSIIDITEPDRDIHLYPNPVDNMLYILGKNEMTYLAILDIQGRKIAEYFPNSINTSIHTDNLKSGIYLVHIYSERKTHTFKVIKN